jgi:hypothetical protein
MDSFDKRIFFIGVIAIALFVFGATMIGRGAWMIFHFVSKYW